MSKKVSFKENFLPIIVLVSVCLIIGSAMAAINLITEPKILETHAKKEAEALSAVVPDNDGFNKEEISDLPESVVALYSDKGSDAVAVMLSVKGYDSSNPMSVAVGFDGEGKIIKCSVIACTGETKGIGSKVSEDSFLSRFIGKKSGDEVDTISGATISSSAFKEAISDAGAAVAEFREKEAAKNE